MINELHNNLQLHLKRSTGINWIIRDNLTKWDIQFFCKHPLFVQEIATDSINISVLNTDNIGAIARAQAKLVYGHFKFEISDRG